MPKLDESNYRRFTISERINLTIAALSRKDEDEISRLRRTCQRKQYTMLDREYTSKLENIAWISSKFSELHNHYYKQMILFSSYIVSHDDIAEISKFNVAYIDQAVCIKSLYEALYSFCDEAGLNKYHVMTWLGIDPKPIFEFIGERTLAMIEQDNELTEHVKKRFLAMWNGDFS